MASVPCVIACFVALSACAGLPNEDPATDAAATSTAIMLHIACTQDDDCAALDDGNACNGVVRCVAKAGEPTGCRVDPASIVSCDAAAGTACAPQVCAPKTGKCGPVAAADGTPCDDGNPCSIGDVCAAGGCTTGPASGCECTESADCAAKDDGDKCNGTLFCDKELMPWRCRLAPSSVVTCPDNDGPCSAAVCDAGTGKCGKAAANDGSPCDDGETCTVNDACAAGKCASNTNTCVCSTTSDCALKEDGDLCNGTLYCDAQTGKCKVNPATLVQCAAGEPGCMPVGCAPKTGLCGPMPAANGTKCDDSDTCTTGDICAAGVCVGGTNTCACKTDEDCATKDDGDKCNGTSFCDAASGTCKLNPASVVSCPSVADTACEKNVCLPAEGTCSVLPREDVLEVCAGDTGGTGGAGGAGGTGGAGLCSWRKKQPGDSADPGPFPCEDGAPCTGKAVCKGGACKASVVLCKCQSQADCEKADDGDLCNGTFYCDKALAVPDCVFNKASKVFCDKTKDTQCSAAKCDAKTGSCGLRPEKPGKACDDGEPCTINTACKDGSCAGSPNLCDDGNLCTKDSCSPGVGCVHKLRACDDGNECTADSCDTANGQCLLNKAAADKTPCNADNDGCTVADHCVQGACKTGPKATCGGDVGACLTWQCKTEGTDGFTCAKVALTDGTNCDDEGSCLVDATCKAGSCQVGTAPRLYTKVFGPTGGFTQLHDALAVTGGGLLVGGNTRPTASATSGDKAWLFAIDKAGKVTKEIPLGVGKTAAGASIARLTAGDVGDYFLAGQTGGPKGTADLLVQRRDSQNKVIWSRLGGQDVASTPSFNCRVTAMTRWQLGDIAVATRVHWASKHKILVHRLTPSGKTMWTWAYTSGGPHGVLEVNGMRFMRKGGDLLVAIGTNPRYTVSKGRWAMTQIDGLGSAKWTSANFYSESYGFSGVFEFQPNSYGFYGWTRAPAVNGSWVLTYPEHSSDGRSHKMTSDITKRRSIAIAQQNPGGFAMVSWLKMPNGRSGFALASFDSRANRQWERTFGSTYDEHPGNVTMAGGVGLVVPGWRHLSTNTSAGATQGVLRRMDAWGNSDCQASGGCVGKSWADCADTNECTATNCSGSKGCVAAAFNGTTCTVTNGCSITAKCNAGACKQDKLGVSVWIRYGMDQPRTSSRLTGMVVSGTNAYTLSRAGTWLRSMSISLNTGNQRPESEDDGCVRWTNLVRSKPGPMGTSFLNVGWQSDYGKERARFCFRMHDEHFVWRPPVVIDSYGAKGESVRGIDAVATVDKGFYGLGGKGDVAHLLRTNQSAHLQWNIAVNDPPQTAATSVGALPDGGAIVGGTSGKIDARNGAVTRINANGKQLWSTVVDGGADEQLLTILGRKTGDAVFAGVRRSGGVDRFWYGAVASDGKVQWTHAAKGSDPSSLDTMILLPDNSVAMAGKRQEDGKSWPLMVRADPAGALLWARSYRGVGSETLTPQRDTLVHWPVTGPLDNQKGGTLLLAALGYTKWGPDSSHYNGSWPITIRTDLSGRAQCNGAGECVSKSGNGACDDGNPCTIDLCDEKLRCVHNTAVGTTCGQGLICADKVCGCASDKACSDGNACNGVERCVAGQCGSNPASAVTCDPSKDKPCVVNQCQTDSGKCALKAREDGQSCGDASKCSTLATCVSGACKDGPADKCEDGNSCTSHGCDGATGKCSATPLASGAQCDDGNGCTAKDTCAGGVCKAGATNSCDDSDDCTVDSCDTATGSCRHVAAGGACVPCWAGRFNDSGRVHVEKNKAFDVGTKHTFAGYMKFDSSSLGGAVINQGRSSGWCSPYWLGVNGSSGTGARRATGSLRTDPTGARCGGKNEVIGSSTLSPGKWYHLAMVNTGAALRLYVDGKLNGEKSAVNIDPVSPVGQFLMGGEHRYFSQRGLRGYLTDVQVWSRALSDAEVKQLATVGQDVANRAGLVARWRYAEGSGVQVRDSSGNGHHGSASNMTWSKTGPGCGDPQPGPLSCVGRCGNYDKTKACQCDNQCTTFKDCCKDRATVCK